MSRTNKIGLEYFPFDVDFFNDIKIRKLIKAQGGKAVPVYACLLCIIYKNGYYMKWDNELPFIISEQTGYEEVYIQEVIKSCVVFDLFSKQMYEEKRILTSKGIQIRYSEICELLRRKSNVKDYSLLINVEEKPINATLMPINATLMQQRKGKEKKINLKDIVSNETISQVEPDPPELPPKKQNFENIDFKNFVEWFNSTTKGVFGEIRIPLGEKRKMAISARVREYGKNSLCEVVNLAMNSNFLKGDNGRGWTATLDWMMKPSNFEKILSKNYENGNKESNQKCSDEQLANAIKQGVARGEYNKAKREGRIVD
jgi:hypothetical protein